MTSKIKLNINLTNTRFAFDCPIHGLEFQVMCFRAFQDENLSRWKKYHIIYNEIETDISEKQKILEELRNSANEGSIY